MRIGEFFKKKEDDFFRGMDQKEGWDILFKELEKKGIKLRSGGYTDASKNENMDVPKFKKMAELYIWLVRLSETKKDSLTVQRVWVNNQEKKYIRRLTRYDPESNINADEFPELNQIKPTKTEQRAFPKEYSNEDEVNSKTTTFSNLFSEKNAIPTPDEKKGVGHHSTYKKEQ